MQRKCWMEFFCDNEYSSSWGDTGPRHLVVALNKVIWDYLCWIIFEWKLLLMCLKSRFFTRGRQFFKDPIGDEQVLPSHMVVFLLLVMFSFFLYELCEVFVWILCCLLRESAVVLVHFHCRNIVWPNSKVNTLSIVLSNNRKPRIENTVEMLFLMYFCSQILSHRIIGWYQCCVKKYQKNRDFCILVSAVFRFQSNLGSNANALGFAWIWNRNGTEMRKMQLIPWKPCCATLVSNSRNWNRYRETVGTEATVPRLGLNWKISTVPTLAGINALINMVTNGFLVTVTAFLDICHQTLHIAKKIPKLPKTAGK